ncbi:MAG: GYDIA family GHMP kinase [Bacteroidales bacterium]
MTVRQYRSNGKFLITGEYLVLKGALALCVPLRPGQSMQVKEIPAAGHLTFRSFIHESPWFQAGYKLPDLEITDCSDAARAGYIRSILAGAASLNPEVFRNFQGFEIKTNIEFDINWGLGSSSSLIANIARWVGVDPLKLHFMTSKGSGYDVACATAEGPLFYRLGNEHPEIRPANFKPRFSENLFFVYTGQKKNSAESIVRNQNRLNGREKEIERISEITLEMTRVKELRDFRRLICEHEDILSKVLDEIPVKEKLFAGLEVSAKSLGAWGGDFALVTWEGEPHELEKYLLSRDLDTFFGFDEIVLHSNKAEA